MDVHHDRSGKSGWDSTGRADPPCTRRFSRGVPREQDPLLILLQVMRDRLEHEVPWNRVKELCDIEVDNPIVLETPFPAHRDRIQSAPPGPNAA